MIDFTRSSSDKTSGQPSPTATHTHLSKDGLYYPSYDEKVEANIRCNLKHLRSMGLGGGPLLKKTAVKRSPKEKSSAAKKTRQPIKPVPLRRSGRLRKEPAPLITSSSSSGVSSRDEESSSDGGDFIRMTTKKIATSARRAARQKQHDGGEQESNPLLTAAQRQKLANLPNWIVEMDKYLRQVEQLSDGNRRPVMRQVEKFATGEGITYKHWDDGVYFGKGEEIDLSWDMQALFNRAVDHEEEHGRDKGNGWLLRHPITKMANFQAHYLLRQKSAV